VIPSFADVMTPSRQTDRSVLATLWCLLARGALYVDLSLPITPAA